MIPAGFMYKRVATRPTWLDQAPHVVDILSVSGCVSEEFTDYTGYWLHNAAWLFDTPQAMQPIAEAEGVDLDPMTLFYYEMHELAYVEATADWQPVVLTGMPMQVVPPARMRLAGFDVATCSQGNIAECSPMSCNGLAGELPVNAHCLLETLDACKEALARGAFNLSEPGPFRIFSVYWVD